MQPRSIRALLTATLSLLGATLLTASCGNDSSGATCSLGGFACQYGCSPSLGCVQCLSNDDCGPGAPVCVLGVCAACAKNSDCGTGEACDPSDHQCRTACESNSDCGGERPDLCDPETHACVGCLASTDCPAERPVCEPERSECSACASRDDCGVATPACNLQTGQCVECLVDSDCGTDYACATDHQCHPLCRSNSDCGSAARPLCNTLTGACVECLTAADCTNASRPVCSDRGLCVGCTSDQDCPAATPICRTGPGDGVGIGESAVCVQCASAADCTDSALPVCSNQGECVAASG